MVVDAKNSRFLAAILNFWDLPTENIIAANFFPRIRVQWTILPRKSLVFLEFCEKMHYLPNPSVGN